ncbi:AAA family ATPase [Stenotrophomonas sp. C3(2023)]|uniref:ATP-dependent nuclease n=1 Tax=Stenotrophomonas sp. C3(2023) TaxID=3080277 RepID=UPI00293D1845|nr:AAA family ATPase [Stenotrophomonas sp. C3(2023)]MDV3469846.1 AAA family ATPase [Stenotrophomonas sp. C3(2023)]
MAVYISQLDVENYRSCVSTTLELTNFTPLVGLNNCGKSNCLTALQWLVRKAKLGVEDFHDPALPVTVTGCMTGITEDDLATLDPKHRAKIEPSVRDGVLMVRREQQVPGGDTTLLVADPDTGEWAPNPAGIDNAITGLFPDPIRIGAMENAEEDASKAKTTTTIGKLLANMLVAIQERHEADLTPHLSAIFGMVSAEGEARFDELGRIDDSINGKIADLFPGIRIKLDFPVPLFNDLIKAGTVRVYEGDGRGRTFGSYGHGAQRAVQMAMVRHLADLKRGAAVAGGVTLLLVDEPELFMHPFAVEQVREALRALSQAGYQVVFSTHSAQMILAKDAKNALLMTKKHPHGTKARPRLLSVVEGLVANPTHQLHQIFSLTNSSQVLFADKVVLTEGKTELRLLPSLFQAVAGKTLGQSSLAIVPMSGVSDTKKSMEVLAALGLPACAIVDLDYAFRHAEKHGFLTADDPDVSACKALLQGLADDGLITLDEGGLPKKGVQGPASKAFELLAEQAIATPHIDALVVKLREQSIWLWSKGAIEPHVGLEDKSESAWLTCQINIENDGVDIACADSVGVRALVNWLVEIPSELQEEAA